MVGCSWLHTMCQCIEYCPQWSWLFYFSHWYCSFCLFHWWWAFAPLICFLLFLVQAPCHPGASPSRSSSSQWWPVTMMNLANDDPNTTMTPTPQQQPPLEQGQPPYYCLLFLLFIVFLWLCCFGSGGLHPLATATFCLYIFKKDFLLLAFVYLFFLFCSFLFFWHLGAPDGIFGTVWLLFLLCFCSSLAHVC